MHAHVDVGAQLGGGVQRKGAVARRTGSAGWASRSAATWPPPGAVQDRGSPTLSPTLSKPLAGLQGLQCTCRELQCVQEASLAQQSGLVPRVPMQDGHRMQTLKMPGFARLQSIYEARTSAKHAC